MSNMKTNKLGASARHTTPNVQRLTVMLTFGAALALGIGCMQSNPVRADAETAVIGKSAPGFSLPNVVTGRTFTLASVVDTRKATVVMFISTRCPVSNAYDDRMEELVRKYSHNGVAFMGINANSPESVAECADHARAHGFTFPILKDVHNVVADSYGARVTPETYVIDSHGILVYHGRIDNSMDLADVQSHELADALDAVLAGKPVSPAVTKSFGCSIKRE